MSDDDILTANDGSKWSYDGIKINGFLEGHAPGVRLAGGYLRERAVALFKDGKDKEAVAMRTLADDVERALVDDCDRKWVEHMKTYPDMVKPAPVRP